MSRSKSYELYVYFVELKSPSPKLQLSTFTSLLPWSLNHARARDLEVQNIGLVVDGLCVPRGKVMKSSYAPSCGYCRQGH